MNKKAIGKAGQIFALILVITTLICALPSLSSCNEEKESFVASSLDDFSGRTVGMTVGSIFDDLVDGRVEGVNYKTYNDLTAEIAALQKGDVDALALDMPVAAHVAAKYPQFALYPENVADDTYGIVLQKNSPYTAKFNAILSEMTSDGTLDRLKTKWFSGVDSIMKIDFSQYQLENRTNGSLRYVYENTMVPMGYVGEGGRPAGFEIELVLMIADRLDMGVEMKAAPFSSLINNLEADMADVATGCVSITEERSKSVDFADSHYIGGAVLVCKKEILPPVELYKDISDFEAKCLGIIVGTSLDAPIAERINGISYKYYDDTAAQIAALKKGDVNGIVLDRPIADYILATDRELKMISEPAVYDEYGFILKKDSPYTSDFSRIIQEFEKDGTLDALKDKWFSGDDERMRIDLSEYRLENRANGTLNYACVNTVMPMNYTLGNGDPAGYEVELLFMIADRLDMGVNLIPTNFGSLINFISSGKAHVGSGCVSITDERRQSVDIPYTHYRGGAMVVFKSAAYVEEGSFFDGIVESFKKTFVTEGRWKLILSGLLVTVEIALASGIIGSLLGFGFCYGTRRKNKLVSGLFRGCGKLIQGIPTVVTLMITYFIIFGATDLDPVIVGIIAFSVMFGISVSGIINTGINAIDNGQWEAGAALGFSRAETFFRIILPPAIRHVLPLYKGEFVSMLKLTSIVGYISVEDLTKAGDLIRSRTYEAFFPLITIALIYFAISALITAGLDAVEIKIDPHRRPRRLPRGISETETVKRQSKDGRSSASDNDILIRVEHLKKAYPNATPLKDVNTTVRRGEVITIIGPSGTGKSTLMRCINRLETPTEGVIRVFGENVCDKATDLNRIRRRMGMVFQSFNLFPGMTVLENIMLAPVALKKQSKQEAYEKAMQLLRSVGMGEKALNYPDQLSGGQKQRVAIARTLAMEPDIVLLDEPTSALDPTMVGEVLTVIRQLADQGLTMMIVTHEMKFARDVSTRIFYMDQGVIYEDGSPEQIFDAPQRNRTRAFVNRLKVLSFEISSPDYDFIAMSQGLQSFGERHLLTRKQITSLRRVFEEICSTDIVPKSEDESKLHVFTEYSEETGLLEMHFIWKGDRYDPMEMGDELAIKLVRASVSAHSFSYEDGRNTLALTF